MQTSHSMLRRHLAAALFLASAFPLTAAPAAGFVCLSPFDGIQTDAAFCVRWTAGTARMKALLGPSGGLLFNGSSSWDDNIFAAAQDWNAINGGFFMQVVGGAFIDPCGPAGPGHACTDTGPAGDNPIFFADSICGAEFGDIIALTTNCFDPSPIQPRMVNSPVFFNRNERWNAYDGTLRRDVLDIRRVILHELGHVMGLLHPDDHDQFVPAIMNRRISNLDRPQADDVAGVRFLYRDGAPPGGGPPPGAQDGCQVGGAGTPTHLAWLLVAPALLLAYRRRAGGRWK